uniref:Ankyrin repeat-containing protein n=1 Tax=Tetraselmis sp. GSL018 TaxID=582737 RepID=A0A061RZB8_9CHLO|mmetsp:Transcript_41647/g.98751  ORF Transcript_41647/g.98751 Transcript_41647/m.98751 type:complete len:262 (-) Transcript_41647:175-960(-)
MVASDKDVLWVELVEACREGEVATVAEIAGSVDLNSEASSGVTPLLAAVESCKADVVKFLLEAGADPNLTTRKGNTPLRAAVLLGDADSLLALVHNGADVNLETARGTPLTTACGQSDVDMVSLLLDKGACLHMEARSGTTPLIAAAREDAFAVVKLLLDRGADPNQTNKDGNTAIDVAQAKAFPKTLSLLMQSAVVRQVESALQSVDRRQREAAAARDKFQDHAMQDSKGALQVSRANNQAKIKELQEENKRLRALYRSG